MQLVTGARVDIVNYQGSSAIDIAQSVGNLRVAAELLERRAVQQRLGWRELQVTSYKLQVTSYTLQVTSYKLQATSYKLQVTSYKLQVLVASAAPRL